MKKIICCAVGAVLLIVAMVSSISGSLISAGAGSKKSVKITSPDEFVSALYGGESSSYTFTEDNDIYQTASESSSTTTREEKLQADTTATYYVYDDEIYCVAEGFYSYTSSYSYSYSESGYRTSQSSEKKYYVDYSISFYTDQEDYFYARIDKFNYQRAESSSSSVYNAQSSYSYSDSDSDYSTWDFYSVVNNWLGQWIDCSEPETYGLVSSLMELVNLTSQTSTLCSSISSYVADDSFSKSGKTYTGQDSMTISSSNKSETKTTIDLSDSYNPKATYYMFENYDLSSLYSYYGSSYSGSGSAYSYVNGVTSISDIGNTKINVGKMSGIEDADEDDVEIFVDELDNIL